jgi:hypothetical protein
MSAKPVDLTKLKPGMRCRMANGKTSVCESCEFNEARVLFYITWTTEIVGNRPRKASFFSGWYFPDGKWQMVAGLGNNIEEILDSDDTITDDFIAAIPEMEKEAATITERYISLGSFQDVGSAFTYLSKEREAAQQEPGENGKACKHDQGKLDLTLVTRAFEDATARAMMHGLKKYGRDNFRGGGFTELRLLAACKRHLTAYIDGEDIDEDSGNCHLDHACGALNMLIDLKSKGLIEDDRFKL